MLKNCIFIAKFSHNLNAEVGIGIDFREFREYTVTKVKLFGKFSQKSISKFPG